MSRNEGLGIWAKIGIAFAMSFVPYLLYMIPPNNAIIAAKVAAARDGDSINCILEAFLLIVTPGVFFFATIFCFQGPKALKRKREEKLQKEREEQQREREESFQNALDAQQKHFSNNDMVKTLGINFANSMITLIGAASREADDQWIEVTGCIEVSPYGVSIDGTNDHWSSRCALERLNFKKERVYLANPKADTLATAKAIAVIASKILASKMPFDPSGGTREITCSSYSREGGTCEVPQASAYISYTAKNAYYKEASPL